MNKETVKILSELLFVLFLVFIFSACEIVFTTSPLAFLQSNPTNLTADQKKSYARDAMASGDSEAMLEIYDAMKADAETTTDGELSYLAATLAMDLAGVSSFVTDMASGSIEISESGINDFIDSLETTYITDAALFYTNAETNDFDLNGIDYFLGGACLLFVGVSGDVGAVTAEAVDDAQDFLAAGLSDPDLDETTQSILEAFDGFMDDLAP